MNSKKRIVAAASIWGNTVCIGHKNPYLTKSQTPSVSSMYEMYILPQFKILKWEVGYDTALQKRTDNYG